MKGSERESRSWALIGKISVVLGIIAAFIVIYQFWAVDTPEITATCFIFEVERATNIVDFSDDVIIAPEERNRLVESLRGENTPEQWAVEAFTTRLELLAKETVAHEVLRFSFRHNPDLICRVKNDGVRTAHDLTLTLDEAPIRVERDAATIVNTDPVMRPRESGRTQIALGDLPPSAQTEIRTWTNSRLFYFSNVILSHRDGLADLEIHDLTPPSEGFSPIPIWPIWVAAAGMIVALSWGLIQMNNLNKGKSHPKSEPAREIDENKV